MAEVIWQKSQQMKWLEILCQNPPLNTSEGFNEILANLNNQMTSLLSNLVTSTFIIEKQPPQVIQTNAKFTSTVRLLVGDKLNVHMTQPQVKVTVISEAQVNSMLKNNKFSMCETSGEILNNNGTMEYDNASRQLSVNFRNMRLKKIKRNNKKGNGSVLDEKFSLLFQSQFNVNGEIFVHVFELSLPVVVISHCKQKPRAMATIIWDNAFAKPVRIFKLNFKFV